MRITIAHMLVSAALFFASLTASAQEISAYRQMINHAKTYYWFGRIEKGNKNSFDTARLYLTEAARLVNETDISLKEKSDILLEIETTSDAVNNQIDIAGISFQGAFPYALFFSPFSFEKNEFLQVYEMFRDPDAAAAIRGSELLVERIEAYTGQNEPYDIFITVTPYDEAIADTSFFIFNRSSSFYIYNDKTLEQIFTRNELDSLRENLYTEAFAQKIYKFSSRNLFMLITIRKVDQINNILLYRFEAQLFQRSFQVPIYNFAEYITVRDSRSALVNIIAGTVILLIISFMIACVGFCIVQKKKFSLLHNLALPFAGFLIGFILPWAIIQAIFSFKPDARSYLIASFWWPAVLGFSLFVLPVVLFKVLCEKIAAVRSFIEVDGKGGVFSLILQSGIAAYLLIPIFTFQWEEPLLAIALLWVSALIIAALVDGDLNGAKKNKKTISVLLAIALSVVIGYTIVTAYLLPLIIALTAAAIGHIFLQKEKIPEVKDKLKGAGAVMMGKGKKQNYQNDAPKQQEKPKTLEQLKEKINKPPFYSETKNFNQVSKLVKPFDSDGKVVWLAITGNAGVGKTASANGIIDELQLNNDILVLKGACPKIETGKTGEPFKPIKDAFRKFAAINKRISAGNENEAVDNALKGVLTILFPFSGAVPLPEESPNALHARNKELWLTVKKTLVGLAVNKRVILLIDDFHWIDDSSKELLDFLMKQFPNESQGKFLFILTSREEPPVAKDDYIEKLAADKQISRAHLKPLSKKERSAILTEQLNLAQDTAERIVRESGSENSKGDLFWLFKILNELYQKESFCYADGVFTFTDTVKSLKHLPIPKEINDSIRSTVRKFPEFREYLISAGCIGLDFDADILAKAGGVSRLRCLQMLAMIEEKSGLILNAHSAEIRTEEKSLLSFNFESEGNRYSFQSSFTFEVIREEFGINNEDSSAGVFSNLIQEYHGRIGMTMQSVPKLKKYYVDKIADHYIQAGILYTEKAIEFAFAAAKAMLSLYQVQKVKEYIAYLSKPSVCTNPAFEPLELEVLLIECDIAFITGAGAEEIAKKCKNYLNTKKTISAEQLIIFIRAFYDAKLFQEALTTSIALLEIAETEIEKAEAYHFMGLSRDPKETAQRQTDLRKALKMVSAADFEEKGTLRKKELLYARIANSLAEELSKSAESNGEEIKNFYNKSIEYKDKYDDKPGLARSYGGLGRYLFEREAEYNAARENFQKDLVICSEIDDASGKIQMHSWLGACSLKMEHPEDAENSYTESLKMALKENDRFSILFALMGLVNTHFMAGNSEKVNQFGEKLLEHVKEGSIKHPVVSIFCDERKDCTEEWLIDLRNTQS